MDLGEFREDYRGQRLAGRLDGARLVPYHDRAEIVSGALENHGNELVWVDDPVEAFFLQVQGSGRVNLDDGGVLRIGYAGANGHPYRSIGRLLIDEQEIPREKMSLQALRRWLAENPAERHRVLNANPSYVFFTEKARGPVGSSGATVTPGRSIATDQGLFPVGALAWIRTWKPIVDSGGERVGEEMLQRLVLNQDTGGAIRGPARVDLFWGHGPEAEQLAGQLKDRGELFFFSP